MNLKAALSHILQNATIDIIGIRQLIIALFVSYQNIYTIFKRSCPNQCDLFTTLDDFIYLD